MPEPMLFHWSRLHVYQLYQNKHCFNVRFYRPVESVLQPRRTWNAARLGALINGLIVDNSIIAYDDCHAFDRGTKKSWDTDSTLPNITTPLGAAH
jgi:hypothetical protein